MIGGSCVRTIHGGAYCVSEKADQPAGLHFGHPVPQTGTQMAPDMVPATLLNKTIPCSFTVGAGRKAAASLPAAVEA
ncbi:hypothetical protein NK6_8919 [Bradyrhizobium diazoefficiens]|uniref:Uncharacterized protein n=1 Tax=Bradyrhizobium diazoefficiens TaxID=1355477 RepID=A0A0E4BX06_9BRAD|nr:hypothetical protein NK6_8919 [Bradyrhizobium diazoefficiens]